MKTIEHFVGGKSFNGNSKRTGKVFNPATGEQSAEVITRKKCKYKSKYNYFFI